VGARQTTPSLDKSCPAANALRSEVEVKGMKLVDKDEICAIHNAKIKHLMACDRCKKHWRETGGHEVTADNLIYP
jgi:hypothetical protein